MTAIAANLKQQAHQLIDRLPNDATWDDVVEAVTEVQAIQLGLDDVHAGRVVDGDAVLKWIDSWGTDDELPPPEPQPQMSRSPKPKR
jgi:predicted transcriptional regulator